MLSTCFPLRSVVHAADVGSSAPFFRNELKYPCPMIVYNSEQTIIYCKIMTILQKHLLFIPICFVAFATVFGAFVMLHLYPSLPRVADGFVVPPESWYLERYANRGAEQQEMVSAPQTFQHDLQHSPHPALCRHCRGILSGLYAQRHLRSNALVLNASRSGSGFNRTSHPMFSSDVSALIRIRLDV